MRTANAYGAAPRTLDIANVGHACQGREIAIGQVLDLIEDERLSEAGDGESNLMVRSPNMAPSENPVSSPSS
jgi:hypothetical protein